MARKWGQGSLRHLGGDKWQIDVRPKRNADGVIIEDRLTAVFRAPNSTEANRMLHEVVSAAYEKRRRKREQVERIAQEKGDERRHRQEWTIERYAAFYSQHDEGAARLRPTTRQRYAQVLENQVIPYIGHKKMADVKKADLKELYRLLATEGVRKRGQGTLSNQTIWTVHMVIRALYAFAVNEMEDFGKNPAANPKACPDVPKDAPVKSALDLRQVERFVMLASERAPEIAVPVLVSARLGTRRGETLALRWSDVSFDSQTVTIRRTVTQTAAEGVIVKETTKTGKERVIPLDADTVTDLRTLRAEQSKSRLALGGEWKGAQSPQDDYITARSDGSLMAPNEFSQRFRTLAKQHGLTAVTPHALRHAFVSQLISLRFDAVTIASMTGHSPEVLLKHYSHAFDERRRDAMDNLAEARKAAREA